MVEMGRATGGEETRVCTQGEREREEKKKERVDRREERKGMGLEAGGGTTKPSLSTHGHQTSKC